MAVVRLRVPATFVLPRLDRLGGGLATVPGPVTSGTMVVVDTEDLALARWGVRCHHDGARWQLLLPPHPAGDDVAPIEHSLRVRSSTIPAAVVHGTRQLRDDQPLTRVARLTVRRRGVGIVRDDGVVVHVSDEEVSVHTGRRLSGRFREVVLQPGPAADERTLERVEELLVEAGALDRDDVPREVRILGQRAVGAPDLPTVGPDAGEAATAWHAALVDGLGRLLLVGAHLRLDTDGRVAAPSLDTVDRLLGLAELLDADAAATSGLATLRALLAEVAACVDRTALLGDDLPGLRDRAVLDRRRALSRLHDHLDGEAHAAAVAAVRALASGPVVTDDEATGPVRASVALRVGKRFVQLGPSLEAGVPGEAAALAALAAGAGVAPGKAPARFARAAGAAAAAAQAHESAVRVQSWCREAAAGLEPSEAFLAGHLAGRRDGDAEAARGAWSEAVARLTAGRATKWLP